MPAKATRLAVASCQIAPAGDTFGVLGAKWSERSASGWLRPKIQMYPLRRGPQARGVSCGRASDHHHAEAASSHAAARLLVGYIAKFGVGVVTVTTTASLPAEAGAARPSGDARSTSRKAHFAADVQLCAAGGCSQVARRASPPTAVVCRWSRTSSLPNVRPLATDTRQFPLTPCVGS